MLISLPVFVFTPIALKGLAWLFTAAITAIGGLVTVTVVADRLQQLSKITYAPPTTQISTFSTSPRKLRLRSYKDHSTTHATPSPQTPSVSPFPQNPRLRNYYDADRDQSTIREWYEMVKTPLDWATAMEQLSNESIDETGKPHSRMNEYLQRAIGFNIRVAGLSAAECLVVTMYSDDTDARAFYREFNNATGRGNWQPYRIYTTLLVSALRALARIDPLPRNTILYQGINFRPDPPTATRIIWKTITSSSLNSSVAEVCANGPSGTVLEFHLPGSCLAAARISDLSHFQRDDEVILLPFQVFDFQSANGNRFYFSASQVSQDCVERPLSPSD